ncbi:MAG: hypothetical protein MZV64_13090 [Ignavibacteriales bacterium]|nr:hypothetical protein [Ignavibacteriales bacterium]
MSRRSASGYSTILAEMMRMSPLSPPSSLETPTTVRSPDLMLSVLSISVATLMMGLSARKAELFDPPSAGPRS